MTWWSRFLRVASSPSLSYFNRPTVRHFLLFFFVVSPAAVFRSGLWPINFQQPISSGAGGLQLRRHLIVLLLSAPPPAAQIPISATLSTWRVHFRVIRLLICWLWYATFTPISAAAVIDARQFYFSGFSGTSGGCGLHFPRLRFLLVDRRVPATESVTNRRQKSEMKRENTWAPTGLLSPKKWNRINRRRTFLKKKTEAESFGTDSIWQVSGSDCKTLITVVSTFSQSCKLSTVRFVNNESERGFFPFSRLVYRWK